MSPHAADLLCLGLTTLDVLARPVDALPRGEQPLLIAEAEIVPAGTAGGTALCARRLGLGVRLASAVGSDRKGRLLRAMLDEEGVDHELVMTLHEMPTSTSILPIDSAGRRPVLHAPGAAFLMEGTPAMIQAAQRTKFLHYGAIGAPKMDGGPGADLLAVAKDAGAFITCDLIAPGPGAWPEVQRIAHHLDAFLPSAVEARYLTGEDDLAQAIKVLLSLGIQTVVVKNGSAGSFLATAGAPAIQHIPSTPVQVVDTTSCGDAYCAGFIAATALGAPPVTACHIASAVAGLVASGLGTFGRLESYEQAERVANMIGMEQAAC